MELTSPSIVATTSARRVRLRLSIWFLRQRPRDRLRDDLGVGARQAIDERPPGRLVFEIYISERDGLSTPGNLGINRDESRRAMKVSALCDEAQDRCR
jgi:hypothetical protein